ncbi:hypothetical protein BYT27DRAFT_7137453 [Phlegmacium glaucopus]|nr:hypothetical protein BYT27DRAFT_7137453 [Phlegmacium glaucopus]
MANFDVEAYYAEQDERMNLPDGDADKYIKQISSLRQSEGLNGDASLRMPQVSIAPPSSRDRALNHGQASEVTTALHVPSESNNLSLVSKTTSKDLSGDVRTIKRKQSDISPEEVLSKRKRVPSQNSVQNHPRAISPQHTRPLNKDLGHMLSQTPAGNVQEPISFDALVKSCSGPMSNEAPSSSGDQRLMDFTSQRSPESPTYFKPAVKRKSSDLQLGAAIKREKTHQEGASTSSPKADKGRPLSVSPSSDSEMPEPIDSFTVDLFGASVPARSMTFQAKLDPVRRVINERDKKDRSPQPPPQSMTTNASPITSFSKPFPSPKKKNTAAQQEPITLAKHPQLDLQPLYEVGFARPKPKGKAAVAATKIIRNPKFDSNPPTSPIEEISVVLPPGALDNQSKDRKAMSKPSELYLEVKERIAKHSTMKKRDRLLKRGGSKVTAPVDESSIIYVSSSSSPSSRASSPIPAMKSAITVTSKQERKPAKQPTEKRKVKGGKEKPQPMTPTEYARSLNEKLATAASNAADSSTLKPKKKKAPVKFLEGKHIFYIGGDMKHASEMTRGRMDLIVKYGGNLMPEYDPGVTTHIVTDALMRPTLRALGLKTLKDIPDHIPTVTWNWVLTVIGRDTLTKDEIDAKLRDVWMHAAFSERMDAGYTPHIPMSLSSFRKKGKEKTVATSHDEGPSEPDSERRSGHTSVSPIQLLQTDISPSRVAAASIRYSGAPPSPPTSPPLPRKFDQASTSKLTLNSNDKGDGKNNHADPLAQFYGKAKAQQKLKEDGWSSISEPDIDDSDREETDDDLPRPLGPIPKRGWTCDNKEVQRITDCPNQDIIEKLSELMGLHKSKMGDDDHWRVFSYSKSIRALKNYPRRIKSYDEARLIRGVGEKTARKIEEILQTGQLRRINYEKTNDVEVSRLFQGIYGVGQSIAHQWYLAGCRTLDDVRAGKGGVKLSTAQEIGLRFYDDINDRMPRSEAKAIFDLIKPIALSIDPKLFIEIMGSYRRGKADCGDIDILITRPTQDGKTHRHVMPRLLQELRAAGILKEDLALPDDPDDLEATYRGLCHLPHIEGSRRRRIDFLSVPWTSRGAALLYYTGDDIFNRAIRLKANVLGYSLNQKGLFGNVVRNPRDRRVKLEAGILVASETEEEIFNILGVPWQEPHERVRG